jgi:hypothetical protein
MRVLVTAMKNNPSKRGSRLRRACSQTRWGGRAVASGDGMAAGYHRRGAWTRRIRTSTLMLVRWCQS